jgi:hypothetical protein
MYALYKMSHFYEVFLDFAKSFHLFESEEHTRPYYI